MEGNNGGTENTEDSSVHCNNNQKKVPSSITVSVPLQKEFDEVIERRVIPKGLLVVLITMGLVLLAGVITLAVLLITQPNTSIAVGPAPTVSQKAEPTETPSPTPTPTSSPTTAPTTAPEESDAFSSIFKAPENEILQNAQDQ